MAERLARIQLLIDTTANWQAANPILLSGEIGLEIKTNREIAFKVGNGTTAWNSLDYVTFTPSEVKAIRDELQSQIDNEIQSQIDNIVIAASTGADPEVAQSRVDASGKTYETLKARLDNSDAIENELVKRNSFNLFDALFSEFRESNPTYYNSVSRSRTSNGITFQWGTKWGQCTVSGTCTSNAAIANIWTSTTSLPDGIEKGKSYPLDFNLEGTNVIFQISTFNAQGNFIWDKRLTAPPADKMIHIPANAVGMQIRLRVEANLTASGTIGNIDFLSAKTNKQLTYDLIKPFVKGYGFIDSSNISSFSSFDDFEVDSMYTMAVECDFNDKPKGFTYGTIATINCTNSEIKGAVQFVTYFDSSNIAYRICWGHDPTWTSWHYIIDNNALMQSYTKGYGFINSSNISSFSSFDDFEVGSIYTMAVDCEFDDKPKDFKQGTVTTINCTNSETKGAVQFVTYSDSSNIAYRVCWGRNPTWTDWNYSVDDKAFRGVASIIGDTSVYSSFDDFESNRFFCINNNDLTESPSGNKGILLTFGSVGGDATGRSGRSMQVFRDAVTNAVYIRSIKFQTAVEWSPWSLVSGDVKPSISMFKKVGVIGDSFASGELYTSGSGVDNYGLSWIQIMSRECGFSATNYSKGGLTTATWLTDAYGLPLVQSNDAEDLYIIALGINDANRLELGTIDDIDDEDAETFYAYYAQIINAIKTKSNSAKIICTTLARSNSTYDTFSAAIKEIAETLEVPCADLATSGFFQTIFFRDNQQSNHPIAINYAAMANAYKELIEKCIIENTSYFANYASTSLGSIDYLKNASLLKQLTSERIIEVDSKYINLNELEHYTGYYYKSDSGIIKKMYHSDYSTSVPFKIKPNTDYTRNTYSPLMLFDEQMNLISTIPWDTDTFTAPSNAHYAIAAFKTSVSSFVKEDDITTSASFVDAKFSGIAKEAFKSEVAEFYGDSKYTISVGQGYMQANGSFAKNTTCRCKITSLIKCKAGDKFSYMGKGEYNAVTWLLYSGTEVVDSGQVTATTTPSVVTIPSGVDGVIFSSYAVTTDEDDVIFKLRKLNNYGVLERLDILESSNILENKIYVACGDSFTQGDFTGYVDPDGHEWTASDAYDREWGCYKTYPYWIAKRNNMKLTNEALSGSILALSKEYLAETQPINYCKPFMYERYLALPEKIDYLTIAFGLNDMYHTNLGTINDSTVNTFYGAWNVLFEYLLTNYPTTKIGTIVMNGYMNETYADAIKEASERWGIPCLDMMFTPNVNSAMPNGLICQRAKELRESEFHVTQSNTHPNVKAHMLQSTVIENFLRSL